MKSAHSLQVPISNSTAPEVSRALLFVLLVALCSFAFSFVELNAMDWRVSFYPALQSPLDPYAEITFINPPWVMIFLFPFAALKEHPSACVNMALNVVVLSWLVVSRKGSVWSVVALLTSFPVLALLANGGIEWIPAIGFLAKGSVGTTILLAKPQAGIFAAAHWFHESKKKPEMIATVFFSLILSVLIWGWWPAQLLENLRAVQASGMGEWNMSLFPYTVPIGIALAFLALKGHADGELLGALASLCLSPYFGIHTASIVMCLLSARYKRASWVVWACLWIYFIFKVVVK